MKKEFVPYELAVKLKELGFDEPCCGYYDHSIKELDTISSEVCEKLCVHDTHIKAPTFSQAFRWFREKYNLHHVIHQFNFKKDTDEEYLAEVGQTDDGFMYFRTYEECECFCLIKLIEIVEEKQKEI